ncbi:sel-2, partial [Symbiodinium microadriaticum]
MVDPTETNSRMTPLLRRNEEGTRHQMATFMSRGKKDSAVTAEAEASAVYAGTSDSKDGGGAKPMSSAFISPQGLWRDLMKYQKNSTNVDSHLDAADKLDVDEDDEESKDAPVDVKKILFKAPVEIITNATNSAGGSTLGVLEVSKNKITFTRSSEEMYSFVNKTTNTEFLWACQCYPSSVWNTGEVWNMYGRSYQLRYVAVEVFFTSRQVVFFNLYDQATQRQFYDVIRRLKPPYLQPHYGYRPSSIMTRAIHTASGRTMTQAWVHRKISNYDYLMYINTVAGRSFNDMSQYPVFPWVIANYTSHKLNLTEAKNFRDLQWPMGAQQEHQREIFRQKYRDLEDCYFAALEERKYITDPQMQSDCLPPFHYGSHYSTMGFVLWYLIRQEPYTSLNIWMQDGRFDKPDRIFDTIELCWRGCTSNQADVKELIPEFFYCPEFLENPNGIALGTTSVQKELGPVGLPPWAKNAHDFVRQHRNALESEYVSAHLHHWIDLVFGHKQRPPHMGGSEAAVDACNVYFHLTYAGAVDLDNLRENDVPLYNQMVRQIDNYGQTPTQLFERPHPRRLPLSDVDIFWPLASVVPGVDTIPRGATLPERPRRVVCFKEHVISISPIVFIGEIASWDKLITVDTSRIVAAHFWQIRPPDVVPPFQFKVDASALRFAQGGAGSSGGFNISSRITGYNTSTRERRVGVPFAPHRLLRSDYVHDMSSRRIRLPAGNKALFEKEEAARSNWRMRGHIGSTSKKSMTASSQDGDDLPEHAKETSASVGLDGSPIVLHRVDEHINTHLFALCPDSRLLFSCGHWDYSFKVSSIDTGRLLQSISQHRDVVTCIDIATDFGDTWLVTGSRDCTLIIWEINPTADKPITQRPLHVLYGHDDAVNCVDVCVELDVVVSGSDDGTIIVHKLREGIYIRSITVEPTPSGTVMTSPSEPSMATKSEKSVNRSLLISKRRVHNVGVSVAGFIYAYSNDDSALYTFTINGHPQARKITGERLHAFRLSEDNRVLITGGERGLIVMRWVHSLELSNVGSKWEFQSVLDGSNAEEYQKPFNSPIRSIYLTQQERHMIV